MMEPLSNFAFKFNLRRYSMDAAVECARGKDENGATPSPPLWPGASSTSGFYLD
jgi:hypothetical protein